MPLVTSDRDFYIISFLRRDFPNKGDVCVYQKSLPDHPEYPHQAGRVRANMIIVGFFYRPIVKEDGTPATIIYMMNSVDIRGWVPKTLVNNFSKSVPRQQFENHERGTLAYIASQHK